MKVFYNFIAILFLVSCSGNSGVTNLVGSTDVPVDLTVQDDILIEALGVLPLDGSGTAKYIVRVNNSTQNYTLASVQIGAEQADPLVATSKLLKLDAAACKKLPADSSCDLQLTPYASTSADVLILLDFRDRYGNQKTVKQMVRMSTELKHNNGFAVFNDLNTLITKDGSYSLALPLILERDFESIVALNGYLHCQDPGFRQGNHCSYLIKGRALADNTLLTTQLTGFVADKKIAQTQANILIKNKAEANLVLSHGVSLIADGRTTSDLSIYNNGTAPAPLKVSVDRDVEIIDRQGCLNQALAAQSECRIGLRAKENQQQRSGVFIVYYDDKSVSTTLNYTSPAQAALVNISSSNSLQNTPISTSNEQIITITNSSSNNLSGIAVGIAGVKPAHLTLGLIAQAQGGCNTLNNITLAAGTSCRLRLQYSPVESENSTTQLQVRVAGAEQKSEIYNHSVNYSAIRPTNYLAISQIKNVTLSATASSQQEEESFNLTNLAPAVPIQLNQVILEDLSGQLKLNSDSCAVGTILDEQHPQCVGRINYASVISEATSKSAHLAVLYGLKQVKNSNVYSQSNNFTFIRKSSTVIDPPIDPESVFESGVKIIESFVVEVSGDGATVQEHELASEPYRIFAERGKEATITLKYIFTNMGSESAVNFTVDPQSISDSFAGIFKNNGFADVQEVALRLQNIRNGCSNVSIESRGGVCSVELIRKYKFLNPRVPASRSSRFGLDLTYCYTADIRNNTCNHVLQNQQLEVTLGWVANFPIRMFYDKKYELQIIEMDDKLFIPIHFIVDATPYQFNTHSSTLKLNIKSEAWFQNGNGATPVLETVDFGTYSCKLGSRQCEYVIEMPSHLLVPIDVEHNDITGELISVAYAQINGLNIYVTDEEKNSKILKQFDWDDLVVHPLTNK